jgi:hypothetical protein
MLRKARRNKFKTVVIVLCILSYFLGVLWQLPIPRSHERQEGTNEHRPDGRRLSSPITSQNSPQETTLSKEIFDEDIKELLSPMFLVQFGLVVVGLIGICIAVGTLRNLRKQTIANRIAANAAHRSAEIALKAAKTTDEVVHFTQRADVLYQYFAGNQAPFTADSAIEIVVKNYGQTRASALRIIYVDSEIQGLESKRVTFEMSYVLGPQADQSIPLGTFGNLITYEMYRSFSFSHSPVKQRIRIGYTDIFKQPHTTTIHVEWYWSEGRVQVRVETDAD